MVAAIVNNHASTGFWDRVCDAVEAVGTRRAIALAPVWSVRRSFVVLVRDLGSEPPPPLSAPPATLASVAWTAIEELDASGLQQLESWLPASEVVRRRREGQRCDLAWIGGRLAHFRWEATGSVYLPYLGAVFVPAPGDRIGTQAFTVPAFRRRGLHSWSTARALRTAWNEQARRSISLVAGWHPAARRVVEMKARRVPVGTVGLWTLGPVRRWFATGIARTTGGRFWLAPVDAAGPEAHDDVKQRPSG
jgi:hypothetical protein